MYKGMIIAIKNTRISFLFLFFLLSLFVPLFAQAQNESTSSAIPEQIDSYNLFWPLSAGKTEADSLYSLKLFKETLVGWVTFGDTKKVDYAILLGTKRVLEAEKLLIDGNSELAIKALGQAETRFGEAYDLAKKAHAKEKFIPKEVRGDRVVNVRRLVGKLKLGTSSEVVTALEKVESKVNLLRSDYLASSKTKTESLISVGSH